MNARVQNDVLRQAAENQYLHTLPSASPRWRPQQADTVTTSILWGALTASTGVILVDLAQLAEAAGELPSGQLQPLTLEQTYAMLGRILEARRHGCEPRPGTGARLSALTPRQHDILREAAHGKSNVEIAQTLHISVETVKSHVRQILMRLEARNRTELAAIYQQSVIEVRARGIN
ncbi:helix-turn-helix transcriptional regulator (plasmid) [Ralstonia solanacearum]|uniref:LuxR C-terminal-related transcriptional regulator n=1 Tax=Ralstonia solanacearum TaxID=305 RepID=A0AAE3T1M7_RALSL|nr:helix-turn-helix transcriptional regulator [Ralstonia solanacearum]KFX28055.1 transcriptional regulator [Ralstonia solanacearum]MBB6584083.1 helix-turn-helix transcriptional regulator [Ralstonia solanacearum]MDB0520164.1 LuxR C-terminal-related transcriptional regulator [Ralstonia solanacearum]QHB57563.1 helix-turn-helix transcriptional regulator [Ralstonia solanacearum]